MEIRSANSALLLNGLQKIDTFESSIFFKMKVVK